MLLALVDVLAILEELGRGAVERQGDLLAGLVAGLLDRGHDEVERRLRRFQVRREAAFVADVGVVAGVLEALLQRVEYLGAQRTASRNVGAPIGMTMNSWKSIGLSACTPPLTMFIIGTGRMWALAPPT